MSHRLSQATGSKCLTRLCLDVGGLGLFRDLLATNVGNSCVCTTWTVAIDRCNTPGGQAQPVVLRPRDSLSSASCELQAPPGHLCLTTSRELCPVAPIKRLTYSDFLAGYMNTGRLDMQHDTDSCRFMMIHAEMGLVKVMVLQWAKDTHLHIFTSK